MRVLFIVVAVTAGRFRYSERRGREPLQLQQSASLGENQEGCKTGILQLIVKFW